MTEETILAKVQKLLDKAWSTNYEEEKQSLLNKAEELMQRYSIEQFQLQDPSRANTAGEVKGSKPEARDMVAYPHISEYEVYNSIFNMFHALARHLGCRVGPRKQGAGFGTYIVVGYPADLDFLEMMHQSLQLHFLSKVDPAVTPEVSWEMNLIALKQAGYKWEQIHYRLRDGHREYPNTGPWERSIGVRFTAIYKKWRDAHPDEPANVSSPKMWRQDFMIGYCSGIGARLYDMRQDLLANDKNLPALLDDKKSLVDEMFEELFPPPPPVKVTSDNKPVRYGRTRYRAMSTAARAAGGSAARQADLTGRAGRVSGAKGEL
jgi:hypothetical protein